MKPDQIYQELKEIAEKLQITVLEQNLSITPGIHVKSGLCRLKENNLFIMDKKNKIKDKIEILASCIGKMSLDDIYIIPAVRDLLLKKGADVQNDNKF